MALTTRQKQALNDFSRAQVELTPFATRGSKESQLAFGEDVLLGDLLDVIAGEGVELGGDIGGTITVPLITGLQGVALPASASSLISGAFQASGGSITGATTFTKNVALTPASTLTPSGTTQTVDFTTGNNQVLSLASATGTVTLTLSNPVAGSVYTIKVTQGASARNISWPGTVKWAFGVAPTISTANGAIDLMTLYYDGTNYLASFNQAYA